MGAANTGIISAVYLSEAIEHAMFEDWVFGCVLVFFVYSSIER